MSNNNKLDLFFSKIDPSFKIKNYDFIMNEYNNLDTNSNSWLKNESFKSYCK